MKRTPRQDLWSSFGEACVVALGVPLYLQLKMIRKQLLPILISQLAGCIVGLVAVTIIAKLMGATPEVIMSLAPKSVTTPIAMEVSDSVGGIPSLTAAVVIVVGLFGAICGFKVLQVGHVGSPIAQGLSMGTASHAVGTSRAMEVSGKYGAYASLGLTLNGILTALLAPTICICWGFTKSLSFKFSNKVIFYQVLLRLFPVCFPDFIRQIARYPSPKIRKHPRKQFAKL